MKKLYIRFLKETDPDFSEEFLESKITVRSDLYDENNKEKSDKKKLFFYVSLSSVYINGEATVKKLRYVIDTFKSEKEKIAVRWVIDGEFDSELKRLCPGIYDEYNRVVSEYKSEGIGEYLEYDGRHLIDDCDAFYGCGGYYMNLCVLRGMPVMVWNVDLIDT